MDLAKPNSIPRAKMIFGSSGQIGAGLIARLSERPLTLSWKQLEETPLERLLEESLTPHKAYDFIFAGGVTDPRRPREELFHSNLTVPQRIMEIVRSRFPAPQNHRFLTLGTIKLLI